MFESGIFRFMEMGQFEYFEWLCLGCKMFSIVLWAHFFSLYEWKWAPRPAFFLSVIKFVPIHQTRALVGEWVQGFFEAQGWLIMMALGSSFSPITDPGSSYLSLSHHRAIHYRFDKTRLKTRWDKFDGYSNKRNRKWPIRDFRGSVNKLV